MKYEQLQKKCLDPNISSDEHHLIAAKLSKKSELLESYKKWKKTLLNIEELQIMQKEEKDDELRSLASSDLGNENVLLKEIEKYIKKLLLPEDEKDTRSAIIEIRAGTGGIEAGIFANELWEMYQKYSNLKGWRFHSLEQDQDGNSLRSACANIEGFGAFGRLKFESGVHRVQRIPETDTMGRVHTSTVSIAILSEIQRAEVCLEDKDLKIETFRASGAGGQHVNKTSSAVRITHLPSGIVAACQDDRSQHANKEKAMKMLYSKLYKMTQDKIDKERRDMRSNLIGSGDRSEKIRTYNFPQNRMTDHRISYSMHNIEALLKGETLDTLIEELFLCLENENLERFEDGDEETWI